MVFNLFKQDCIRLVFWGGAKVNNTSGFLEGDYADGRRLAIFSGMQDVKFKKGSAAKCVETTTQTLGQIDPNSLGRGSSSSFSWCVSHLFFLANSEPASGPIVASR